MSYYIVLYHIIDIIDVIDILDIVYHISYFIYTYQYVCVYVRNLNVRRNIQPSQPVIFSPKPPITFSQRDSWTCPLQRRSSESAYADADGIPDKKKQHKSQRQVGTRQKKIDQVSQVDRIGQIWFDSTR